MAHGDQAGRTVAVVGHRSQREVDDQLLSGLPAHERAVYRTVMPVACGVAVLEEVTTDRAAVKAELLDHFAKRMSDDVFRTKAVLTFRSRVYGRHQASLVGRHDRIGHLCEYNAAYSGRSFDADPEIGLAHHLDAQLGAADGHADQIAHDFGEVGVERRRWRCGPQKEQRTYRFAAKPDRGRPQRATAEGSNRVGDRRCGAVARDVDFDWCGHLYGVTSEARARRSHPRQPRAGRLRRVGSRDDQSGTRRTVEGQDRHVGQPRLGNDLQGALRNPRYLVVVAGYGRQPSQVANHLRVARPNREFGFCRIVGRPEEDHGSMSGAVVRFHGLNVSLECKNPSRGDPGPQLSVPAAGLDGCRPDGLRSRRTAAIEDYAVLQSSAQSLFCRSAKQPFGLLVPMDAQPGRIDDDQPGLQLRE